VGLPDRNVNRSLLANHSVPSPLSNEQQFLKLAHIQFLSQTTDTCNNRPGQTAKLAFMPSMFGSTPFKYGKVSDESSTDDESQTYPGPGRVTSWIRLCNFAFKLRWPSTLFLLFVILAAQVQILHRQPAAMPVGGEINGIVPHCTPPQNLIREPKLIQDSRHIPKEVPQRHALQLRPQNTRLNGHHKSQLARPRPTRRRHARPA
jgi:hypothetical protein